MQFISPSKETGDFLQNQVKVVEFSDYITPDKALADGDIDLVSYQHKPFLDNFNKQNGTDLVPIGNTILMRMGIYSDKYKSVDALPDGAVIAIPNDPTNGGRGLALLQRAGLLKLKDGVGFKATPADVVDNPKHFQFKEIEAAQLPRSLGDVDAAVITMNYVMSAGLNVKEQGIFLEPKDEPLAVMVLAVRAQDKDNPTYKKIAEIFHSDAVKKFIADKYNGTIEPAE
ncbi:MetQ/NlpA family ABC transporter substrate-binding protein [Megasphaera elsdenii]|uniref:MetQ/NlpA family ABC transporter substrate-binding protein n=1 Tax=Megasphaera elsdenii TaxID=907 RepID=UPI003527ABB8